MDPWAVLPPHISIHHMELERLSAVTDGHSTIWLDERLTEIEARCALAHELVHLELGHVGHQPPAVEDKVRQRTARWLVPFSKLWRVRHWQGPIHGLAEDLGVTPAVLRDRLRWSTHEERDILQTRHWDLPGEC
jgi:hypothetical protein